MPALAIVTQARGTFFKPLYEALAHAQPQPWRTLIVWPSQGANEHPSELVTPQAPNIDLRLAAASTMRLRAADGRLRTFLPSLETWRILRASDVRAVIIHEFSPFSLQGLFFAKLRRIPVVVSTDVGRGNAHLFNLRTRVWHGLWGRFVDGIVACCPAAKVSVTGRNLPVVQTYHAADSRVYKPVPAPANRDARVVFAYLGQLVHRKGLDLLLDAASRLRENGHSNFAIHFIGGGDDSWLRECINRRGLEAHCELKGFLSGSAIRAALGSTDVFVLPTRWDSYAAVVHEAACLGLPLLISKHAGAAEALVEDGVNGFVIDPENTADFAERMRMLMDARLRGSFGAASRIIGESHSAHLRGVALWQFMEKIIGVQAADCASMAVSPTAA